jgi:hypothetical protein
MVKREPVLASWHEIALLVCYMLSTGAAAAGLGVAFWAWSPHRGWPMIFAMVVWALVNAGFLSIASAVPGDRVLQGLSMSSPLWGVWTLAAVITRQSSRPFDAWVWAIVWTIAFAAAAAILMLAAIAGCARAKARKSSVESDWARTL